MSVCFLQLPRFLSKGVSSATPHVSVHYSPFQLIIIFISGLSPNSHTSTIQSTRRWSLNTRPPKTPITSLFFLLFFYSQMDHHQSQRHHVSVQESVSLLKLAWSSLKETFFPSNKFRNFKNQPLVKKIILPLQHFIPIFKWGSSYTMACFKADLIAGITTTTVGITQAISYAKIANLPLVFGLYSSFVPPIIYTILGSSKEVAVGTIGITSNLIFEMLNNELEISDNPKLYIQLVLGMMGLAFVVEFMLHAAIVGFMPGSATIICLQQIKGVFGVVDVTKRTNVISIMMGSRETRDQWRWESALLGCVFLVYLVLARYFRKKNSTLFWINAIAPLISIGLGSTIVYLSHADSHGVEVVRNLSR